MCLRSRLRSRIPKGTAEAGGAHSGNVDGLGLKAVVTRPGLIDWNPISRTHTLEQMLLEIGEPVYRWKRKEVVE